MSITIVRPEAFKDLPLVSLIGMSQVAFKCDRPWCDGEHRGVVIGIGSSTDGMPDEGIRSAAELAKNSQYVTLIRDKDDAVELIRIMTGATAATWPGDIEERLAAPKVGGVMHGRRVTLMGVGLGSPVDDDTVKVVSVSMRDFATLDTVMCTFHTREELDAFIESLETMREKL